LRDLDSDPNSGDPGKSFRRVFDNGGRRIVSSIKHGGAAIEAVAAMALEPRAISPPRCEADSPKRRESGGNANSGAVVPAARVEFERRDTRTNVRRSVCSAIVKSLSALHFLRRHRAALCRPRLGPPRCRCHCRWQVGRERPPLPPPGPGPGPCREGSLTPQMHVAIVRQNCALSLPSPNAPLVSDAVST
jgi:hypothetical protein